MPNRGDIYGKPGVPIGTCNWCKRNYKVEELQEVLTKPGESFWLCPRCAFKKRLRQKLSSRI